MYAPTVFNQIEEGMEVYDSEGVRIGTIEAFRLGEGMTSAGQTDIVTIAEIVAETIGTRKELPTVLYNRLYADGFAYVPRGILRPDVLIFPDQIDSIEDEQIYLNVERGELLKV